MRTAEIVQLKSEGLPKSLITRLAESIKNNLLLSDSVGVLLQKFREASLERTFSERDELALKLYSRFLSQYKIGIRDYKIAARVHSQKFAGILKHNTYPNQELRIKEDGCSFVWSTVKYTDDGFNGDRVTIVGDHDGRELFEVRYERLKNGVRSEYVVIGYEKNGAVGRCGNCLR